MTWPVRDLKKQAARVRDYWRARPRVTLSADGATLLSMVEALPSDAVVLRREVYERLVAAVDKSIGGTFE